MLSQAIVWTLILSELKQFFSKTVEELREELLSLKGIGPETADSIILYAAEKPIFVIDAYTKRIMERLGFVFKGYDDLQELFMKELDKDHQLFNEFHALLVEHAKKFCTTNPVCSGCYLHNFCTHNLQIKNRIR